MYSHVPPFPTSTGTIDQLRFSPHFPDSPIAKLISPLANDTPTSKVIIKSTNDVLINLLFKRTFLKYLLLKLNIAIPQFNLEYCILLLFLF